MVLILPEHSQRPYRYGMTLLCIGAMFNWLGLADNNAEPVRYIGVTLIAAGAMLVCLAMCFWMKATHDPQVAALQAEQDTPHHIVTLDRGEPVVEKPPDYETVTGALPPSYEDAIRLGPGGTDGSNPEREQPQSGSSGDASSSAPSAKPPGSNGPDEDNFGSKVLRISRRFLRRTRGQDPEEGVVTSALESDDMPVATVR